MDLNYPFIVQEVLQQLAIDVGKAIQFWDKEDPCENKIMPL